MPAGIVFHKADALALGGGHHDGSGLTLDGLSLVQSLLDGVEVVAVDGNGVETEGQQLDRKSVV